MYYLVMGRRCYLVLSSPVQNPSITNTRENTNAGMLCAESVTCSHDTHL